MGMTTFSPLRISQSKMFSLDTLVTRKSEQRKKRVTWHAAVKMYLTARDEDERDVIEFEWNLSGAVRKAYETMQQL